ncbi:VanZ family protein [Streptomyces harbinensis]|uniref:VanZ family protein n=1 Tax=Streptomyces harbinensis TaxID=1176198 RepID=UPI0034E03287
MYGEVAGLLSAVFSGHQSAVFTFFIVTLIAMVVVYTQMKSRRLSWALLFGSVASIAFITLYAPDGSGYSEYVCTVNRQVGDSFTTLSGLLNIAIFAPIGFFSLMATRSLLIATVGPAVFSFGIEVSQGVMPFIARTCDSTDWVSNSSGGAIGAMVSWALIAAARNGSVRKPTRYNKRVSVALVAVAAGFGLLGKVALTPLFIDATGVQSASREMREIAQEKARNIFGNEVELGTVNHLPGVGEPPDIVTFHAGGANFSMEWPDHRRFQMYIGPWQKEFDKELDYLTVDGPFDIPRTADDALAIATYFVAEKFPWALIEAEAEAYSLDEEGQLGWMVNWRRYREGILMPMRLDVQIDLKGNVAQFIVAEIDDPHKGDIPSVLMSEHQARLIVNESGHGGDLNQGQLILSEIDGRWQVFWVLTDASGLSFRVNAESGKLETSMALQ